MKNTAILLVSCPDQKGVVASISDFIFHHNGNILHADEHADEGSNLFLMRIEFDPSGFDISLADFAQHFSPIAGKLQMTWRLAQSSYLSKMVILVSKYDHCLVDLDRSRQNDFFQIAAFLQQVIKGIAMRDANHILLNDRPVIENFRDVMAGSPNQLYTAQESLVIGLGADKRRQKRMVNVDDAMRILIYEVGRQNLHVASEHDEIRPVLSEQA
jgi:predicted amino acid-binding ACT domain protein